MAEIHIANAKGRDAVVTAEGVITPVRVRWMDEEGRAAAPVQILRGSIDRDLDVLETRAGSRAAVAELLVAEDAEIDIETFGQFINHPSRVYVGPDKKVVHRVIETEIVKNPDGTVKETRLYEPTTGNVNTEVPLRWTGRLMKRADAIRRVVFAQKQQIVHVNGLTYDFLYAMAKELEDKESFLLVGGGPRGQEPLVFHRGAIPFRGFLEGRTRGDKYLLVLHLSNQELKAP